MPTDAPRRDEFSQIGGHPVLDLINTVQWRLSGARWEDDLVDFDDVVRWAEQLGLVSSGEATTVRRLAGAAPGEALVEWTRVRELREAVYATAFEGAPPVAVVEEYRDAVAPAGLVRHDEHWGWDLPVDVALVRRRVALSALELLTDPALSRLAQCQDAECGWVFLDTSPRHDRRWCVSADCGNRNRVRDYYARTRAGTGAGTGSRSRSRSDT